MARSAAVARATKLALDLVQPLVKLMCRQLRVQFGHGVQELRLMEVTPRLGLTDRRKPVGAEQCRSAKDRRLAIAEIRSEPDVRRRHGGTVRDARSSRQSAAVVALVASGTR